MWTKSFSRYTHILLVSAAVIIGAQISISLFESDFRVSIGIFGIFMSLILFGKYPILPVTVISALCVFFSRTLMHWLRFGSWNPQNYFPEMFFYLVYGILFFLYCRKNDPPLLNMASQYFVIASSCSGDNEAITFSYSSSTLSGSVTDCCFIFQSAYSFPMCSVIVRLINSSIYYNMFMVNIPYSQ